MCLCSVSVSHSVVLLGAQRPCQQQMQPWLCVYVCVWLGRCRKGAAENIGVEGIIRKGVRVVFVDSSPETVRRHAPLITLCFSLAHTVKFE